MCDFHDDGEWRVFHLLVWNRGKATARGCRGKITIAPLFPLAITGAGLVTERSITSGSSAALDDVGLPWARADKPVEISIHPGSFERLEIGRARSRSPMENSDFTIPTELGYSPPRVVFSGPGCEYMARITAENAEPTIVYGRMLWSELNPTVEISLGPTQQFVLPPSLVQQPWWKRIFRLRPRKSPA